MTYREVQIESLWTYEISTKKVLQLAVKKDSSPRQMNSLKSCLSSWTRGRTPAILYKAG